MLWKDWRCRDCRRYEKNSPSKVEETLRECPDCGGKMFVVLTPKPTKFKGGGWQTKRPVETFDGEPEDASKWGPETHGVEASLARQGDD